MWLARETLDLSEMKTESSCSSRLDRWSAAFFESRVRSDQAKPSLVLEKDSACAPTESQVQKPRSLTSRHSATPKLYTFLLFPARQYGVAEL